MAFFTLASLILTAASAATSIYSGYQQGEMAEDQAEYEATLKQQQAEMEAQARAEEQAAETREAESRRALVESQYANSGVLLQGTPNDMLLAQTRIDAENIASRDYVSQMRQQALRSEAMNIQNLGEYRKKTSIQNGWIKGANTLLSTAATMYTPKKSVPDPTKTSSYTHKEDNIFTYKGSAEDLWTSPGAM